MKSTLRSYVSAVVAASMLVLTACGGGGGGSTSTGGTPMTHEQVAREFVRRVNLDIQGFDLELVKINTLQYGYIVVYDWDYNSYDAYYIGQYNVGENLANYINAYEDWFYYDLWDLGGNLFEDPITGTRFEKVQATSKDLAKMKALKEELVINRAAEKLRAEYGLSVEKSLDTARFAYKVQNSPEGTYTAKDFDAFSKELTGSSITEFQNDAKAGDMVSLAKRIDTAADVTGMGVEGVNKLINEMFIK